MSTIAKQEAGGQPSFLSCLFQAGLYKPAQGRLVRQVFFAALAIVAVLFVREVSFFSFVQRQLGLGGSWALFGALALLCLWVSFRVVNYPRMADFLISVEAELNKVSWPSRPSLWKATGVVIFVILGLAVILFAFDLFWTWVFQLIQIRN